MIGRTKVKGIRPLTKGIEWARKIADLPVSFATFAPILRGEYGGF